MSDANPWQHEKIARKPLGRTSHQFVEECLLLAVDVAEKGEIQRKGADRQTVNAQVSDGFIVEDHKTREMQRVELRERDQWVVWVNQPRRLVHGGEQAAQFRLA